MLNEMKTEKAPGSSEFIVTSGRVGIQVMAKIFQSPKWICNAS